MSNLENEVVAETNIVERSVNIDSRDRNKNVDKNTNEYTIKLKDALFNVQRIELVSAEIPKSEYFVDDTNNLLEILIDPVLFANNAPTGYTQRLISQLLGKETIAIMRVDSSQTNGNGVIEVLSIENDTIQKGSSSIFNASRTSSIDFLKLSETDKEVLFVSTYSEDEDNFSGNCRFMMLKYGNEISDSTFSFGSEFRFEVLNGFPIPVFDKRICLLVDNKFALVYNKNNESVNLLVGSVGTNIDDTDGRLTNSNLVEDNVNIYSVCSVDETKSFVVYCVNDKIECKLIIIDSDFALSITDEIQIDEMKSVNLSCDCMNKRIVVSSVDVFGNMKAFVLLVIEGPDLILLTSAQYSIESAQPSLNISSSESFKVDPNSVVKWTSDVFRIITLQVQRIDMNIAISLPSSSQTFFPSLELEKHEYHRILFVPHPLDSEVPFSILESIKIFTSETHNSEYSNVKKDSTSILLFADDSVNTLFYGIEGQTNRGIINMVQSISNFTIPFNIFVSGVHDAGNKPFTFRSSKNSIRSLRYGFESPGPNIDSLGKMVSVNGTGFLFHESSELWSFRDGQWSLMSDGGLGNTEQPGPRNGVMLVSHGKVVYLFGGISTQRSAALVYKTPNYSLFPLTQNSYALKNLKNTNDRIFFYDIVTQSTRVSFTSLIDPSLSLSGWSGLKDITSFFEKPTFGFFVNSFSPAKAVYLHHVNVSSENWGDNPNPTGYVYQLEFSIFPRFESVDISGTIEINQDAQIHVDIFDGINIKISQQYILSINMWSNISVVFDTSNWESNNLQNMKIEINCINLFMKQGLCAIRDPELFVLNYQIPYQNFTVEMYFSDIKQDPKISFYNIPPYVVETENVFMNDLWSIVAEPFFSLLQFSLLLSEEQNVIDRCNKLKPTIVENTISKLFLSTFAVNVSEGPFIFSDRPSMMFNGTNVFTLPSSGNMIRENTTGDFTFSCSIEPRVCKVILSVDYSSTGVVVNGQQPSVISTINASNSKPNIYRSGKSMIFDQSTVITFPISLPGKFIVNAFFFIPSSASGSIVLLKIGNLSLIASDDDTLSLNSLKLSFPRNQWIHVSLMGNGMAFLLTMDDTSTSSIVARDMIETFQIGGGGWNGTILVTGMNVCTSFGNKGLNYLLTLSNDHKNGYLADNFYTIMSCGINNSDLRLFIDCTGNEPFLVASLLNKITQQVLPDGVIDVCMGRENKVIRLLVGSSESSFRSSMSTSLLLGDVKIGGRQGFNQIITHTYCGAADDIKFLIGRFDSDMNTHVLDVNGLRTRSMIWKSISYLSNANNAVPLSPRAYGSLTVDSAVPPNLWLFGGEGVNGSANDLWQITTAPVSQSYHISGSSLSTGRRQIGTTPGSRSRFAYYNDGENIYIFGGETGPSIGPFQFTGIITKLFYQSTEFGSPVLFWQASPTTAPISGSLYPVFTKKTAVFYDASDVVWAEVSDGINIFYIYLFEEENQMNLGINAFLRSYTNTNLPFLIYEEHVNTTNKIALADFWRYSINTASWELLNIGSQLTSATSPGVRSRCNLHYDKNIFYLLPGQSSLNDVYTGQDLWSIREDNNWEWMLLRNFKNTPDVSTITHLEFSHDSYPGSTPSLYWKDDKNMPNLWTASGRVFTNQLTGEIQETNLHYCITINSEFKSNSSDGSAIEFVNRITVDDTTIYPGVLDVDSLSSMGDGCFLVTTSKLIFLDLSLSNSSISSYDPTQLPNSSLEIVYDLPDATFANSVNLIRGVKYEFKSIRSNEVNIPTTQEIVGVSIIANENFTITTDSVQINFNVIPFNTHEYILNFIQSDHEIHLESIFSTKISDLVSLSAFSHHSTSTVQSNFSSAKFRFTYQNLSNNRYGEVSTIYFDRSTGTFSLLNNITFSSANPTFNITNSSALFENSIIMFSNQNGTSSILCNDTTLSPSTLQSSVAGSNVNICVLNHFQMSASNTEWMFFFIYNENLRVCAQKTISNQLNAPVQNLVGENIKYSNSIALDLFSSEKVRICRLESGILLGEIVAVYSNATSLFYKDALVSQCDPLNTNISPSVATQTFSLVSQVNLVSTNFSDFEVISLSSISSTNFVVFYLSLNRLNILYKVFVREAGSYLSQGERLLFVFSDEAEFVKVSKADLMNTYHLHFIINNQIKILYTVWEISMLNPIDTYLRVVSTILQTIDNSDPMMKASSILTSNKIVSFSVHESSTSQICPITLRSTDIPEINHGHTIEQQLLRKSFKTRIQSGDYNLISLFVNEIRTKLIDIDSNFDCVYDNATTKISITNKFSNFTLLLSSTNYSIEDENASNGLGYILGFRDFNDVVSSFNGTTYSIDSTNRIDIFGRQYLYLFLSTPDGPISSEVTSRNKENAFGRIILSVEKGQTMFFTSSIYEVFADVSIPVITQFTVKLVRFAEINNETRDSKDIYLYQPQGMEHSFSLKIHCALDKIGSRKTDFLKKQPYIQQVNFTNDSKDSGNDSESENDTDEEEFFFG
jgi:hypothetical protein